ncbi:fasciclin domain-containing protein [Paraprevotella clara]|jgi:lipoprotein|uniref:fasciclin domain-containing protein n=1 Tax=Paraprevotella clara TaxID=454154 RepID=UPI0026761530|nr:fasciclin domain-containing protein [Paraprevotella clara]
MKTMKYILMAFLPLMALSCQDEWDEHYGQANPMASQESLWQALKGRAELSNFVRLVENVGYEYYFDGDRMFTLFVPTNDCLTEADVDSLTEVYNAQKSNRIKNNDNTVIKQVLQNHMAMYNYAAIASGDSVQMMMLNGKYSYLADGGVNGVKYLSSNMLYRNGVLFTVGSRLPYFANVSEYFTMDDELDSIASFFSRYNVYEFDASRSVPGEIVDGKTVYLDSVMNLKNVMFDELGYINREDSAYWIVVPTDRQWRKLYEEYKTYFNYDNRTAKRDSVENVMTHKAIVQGTVFNMNVQPSVNDSVISTNYNKANYRYYKCLRPFDEGGVFSGARSVECSNGKVFISDNWEIDKRTTFFQEVKIEAENAYYQDSIAKCKEPVSTYTVPSGNPLYGQVSGNAYVQVEPRNTAVTPLIRFTIPNLLSNIGYDIYAVFAPAIASDTLTTDTLPLKVKFSLKYNDQDGRQVNDIKMENPEGGTYVYETTPNVVDTILVARDYKIPTCSYGLSEPQVRLTVESDRGTASKYTRILRLDCIVFKPHEDDNNVSNE